MVTLHPDLSIGVSRWRNSPDSGALRHVIPIVLLLAACGGRADPSAGLAPVQVVERFYSTYIAAQVTGAPTAVQLAQLAPYLSDTLVGLLRAARLEREAGEQAAPCEKPAFAEGDLVSSLFEGPSTVVVESKDTVASPRVYLARLGYQAADGPFTWTDEVLVNRESDRWVITDIRFQGTWDFAQRGTLRQGLEAALAE